MGEASPSRDREGGDGGVGAGVPCGAHPDPVHATVAPGAGRGGGVQRDTTDGWLLWSPLFPLAVRPRGVAAHGRPLPVGKTRELYLFPVFFNTTLKYASGLKA